MPKAIAWFDQDGATQITGKVLAEILAGIGDTPIKIGVQNVGDEDLVGCAVTVIQVGSNDGWTMGRIGRDSVTVGPPVAVTAELSAPGASGVFATGAKYYVVTAVTSRGESTRSREVSAVITASTQLVTLMWDEVPGTLGYRVYRTTVAGTYPASALIAELIGSTAIEYLDGGAAASVGTVPSANTTGGGAPGYGTWPALSSAPISFGDMPVGQFGFLWFGRVVTVGTDDQLNPRLAALELTEN